MGCKYWGPWLDTTHPNPAKPGELRWFTTVAGEDREVDGPGPHIIDGEAVHARSRTFIRATLSGNPVRLQPQIRRVASIHWATTAGDPRLNLLLQRTRGLGRFVLFGVHRNVRRVRLRRNVHPHVDGPHRTDRIEFLRRTATIVGGLGLREKPEGFDV